MEEKFLLPFQPPSCARSPLWNVLGDFLFKHSAQRRRFNLHFLHFLSFISSFSRVFLLLIYIEMKLKTNRAFECDYDDFECVIELRKYNGQDGWLRDLMATPAGSQNLLSFLFIIWHQLAINFKIKM